MEYESKFVKNKLNQTGLTEYEKTFGFTEISRQGSRAFNNIFGTFMEKIILMRSDIPDFEDSTNVYELKSKFNTVKGSDLHTTLGKVIASSVAKKKGGFYLILVDNRNKSRNIPMHEFCGRVLYNPLYNPAIHRVVTGEKLFELIFGKDGLLIKKCILEYLEKLKYKINKNP